MLRRGCGFKLANDGVDTRSLQAYLGASQHSEYGAVHRVGPGSVRDFCAEPMSGPHAVSLAHARFREVMRPAEMSHTSVLILDLRPVVQNDIQQ